jgi:hypothetical protein
VRRTGPQLALGKQRERRGREVGTALEQRREQQHRGEAGRPGEDEQPWHRAGHREADGQLRPGGAVSIAVPTAKRYVPAGYYQNGYPVGYDAQAKEYRIALTGLGWRN